jgi:hypothetical protein
MILRVESLESTGVFNSRIGPGSNSLIQAGEVTDLLYRAQKIGKRNLVLNTIASVDFREKPMHSVSVDFKHGVSFGVVHKSYDNQRYVIFRILSPIFRTSSRITKSDSPDNVVNLVAMCLGRLISLFIPNFLAARIWLIK